MPPGVLWTVLALGVVLLVWSYDRSAQRTASDHVATAEVLEEKQDFKGAFGEYEQALENGRLNKRTRAGVALSMARLAEDHLGQPGEAARLLTRARDIYPRSVQDPVLQEKLKRLGVSNHRPESTTETKANGRNGHNHTAQPEQKSSEEKPATKSALSSVNDSKQVLAQPPVQDMQGPVVATFGDTQLHAGEVKRMLGGLKVYKDMVLSGEVKNYEELVNQQLERALLYKAAVDAGIADDPDVASRVYDYQRTLVSERFLEKQKSQSAIISTEAVEKFYEANKERFGVPGRMELQLLKTAGPLEGERAYKSLMDGVSFEDVISSYTDTSTLDASQVRGSVNDTDNFLPGLGPQPEVISTLKGLKEGEFTSPTLIAGSTYIIGVVSKSEAHTRSLDEMRPKIEIVLRREAMANSPKTAVDDLTASYTVRLNRENIRKTFEEELARLSPAGQAATDEATTTSADASTTRTPSPSAQSIVSSTTVSRQNQ
jgi:tetratricopeptide (TPR) repeat protein